MPAKTPEQRRAYEAARRRSKRVKFRLTEDEAQRIRDAAAGAGMSLHTYMLAVADGRARPVVDLAHVAEFSTPIAALLAAPQAVYDLEADLGRLSERLAHLFMTDYALPSEHRAEIQATLGEVRDVLRAIPPAIAALQAETAEPRAEIGRVLRAINTALEV
jgi:uncharacterized protein (DUF1778 family)